MAEETGESSGKGKEKRRKTSKLSVAAGIFTATTMVGVSRMADTTAAENENTAMRMTIPSRFLKESDLDTNGLFAQLKADGYNIIVAGDGSHNSHVTPRVTHAAFADDALGFTNYFIEGPEKGKDRPGVKEELESMDYQKAKSPLMREYEKVKALIKDKKAAGREITTHLTDSYLGPDNETALKALKSKTINEYGKVEHSFGYAMNGREYIRAGNSDVIFRNHNMKDVVTRVFKEKQAAGEPFFGLFVAGNDHCRGPENVPELLNRENVPGMKVAYVEVMPVRSKEMDGKVWQCAGQSDHFIITQSDLAAGYNVSPKGVIENNGVIYQFPPEEKYTGKTQPFGNGPGR